MEHLTKQQLILLALLVSFVSSIATGIVTVTLMQQAPRNVTQTINRVVEKTIEKVVPVTVKGPTETKIIIEGDFVVAAIEKNQNSIVGIRRMGEESVLGEIISYGVVLSEDGLVATDASSVSEAGDYYAEFSDKTGIMMTRVLDKRGFSIFKIAIPKESKDQIKFSAVELGDANALKIGQSVVSLGENVATGIVSGFIYDTRQDTSVKGSSTTTTEVKYIAAIRGSTNGRDSPGSALLNLDGAVVGVVGFRSGEKVSIPANLIREALEEIAKKKSSSLDGNATQS